MTPTPIQPKRGMGVGTRTSLQARHCSVNHTVNCRPLTFKHSNPPSGTAASFCPADRDPCVKFTLFRPPCKNHGKNAPRLHRPGGLPPGPGPGGVPRTGPARRQARRAGDFSLAHGLAPPIRNQGNRSPHENPRKRPRKPAFEATSDSRLSTFTFETRRTTRYFSASGGGESTHTRAQAAAR